MSKGSYQKKVREGQMYGIQRNAKGKPKGGPNLLLEEKRRRPMEPGNRVKSIMEMFKKFDINKKQ